MVNDLMGWLASRIVLDKGQGRFLESLALVEHCFVEYDVPHFDSQFELISMRWEKSSGLNISHGCRISGIYCGWAPGFSALYRD